MCVCVCVPLDLACLYPIMLFCFGFVVVFCYCCWEGGMFVDLCLMLLGRGLFCCVLVFNKCSIANVQ